MSESAKEVLENHLKAFESGNLPEIMKHYTDESVLINPEKILKGLKDIEGMFAGLFKHVIPPENTNLKMINTLIEDDLAYIFWSAESDKFNIPLGSDTFIIRDGKILQQTFAGLMKKKSS